MILDFDLSEVADFSFFDQGFTAASAGCWLIDRLDLHTVLSIIRGDVTGFGTVPGVFCGSRCIGGSGFAWSVRLSGVDDAAFPLDAGVAHRLMDIPGR